MPMLSCESMRMVDVRSEGYCLPVMSYDAHSIIEDSSEIWGNVVPEFTPEPDFVANPTFQQSIADEANSATVEYFSGNGFAPIHPAIVPGYDGDIDYAWGKK